MSSATGADELLAALLGEAAAPAAAVPEPAVPEPAVPEPAAPEVFHTSQPPEPGERSSRRAVPAIEGHRSRFLPMSGVFVLDLARLRGTRPDEPLEILAPHGTSVHAVTGGTVRERTDEAIVVGADGGFTLRYGDIDPVLEVGAEVAAGELIGRVTSSGFRPRLLLWAADGDGRAVDTYALLVHAQDPVESAADLDVAGEDPEELVYVARPRCGARPIPAPAEPEPTAVGDPYRLLLSDD